MSMSDPLGDMITRLRNGQHARLKRVSCPFSKLRQHVLEVLRQEGYIRDFKSVEMRKGIAKLDVELKYHNGQPVIQDLKRISKPGRRVYNKAGEIKRVYNGLGISILTTPQGVMSDVQARTRNLGGEILCNVF